MPVKWMNRMIAWYDAKESVSSPVLGLGKGNVLGRAV
jgi:hypothetical protein